ncbi:MAG: alpha-1,2-fucosyltransferase [Lachnospiraceae bacterium]|nr:alpha-1,2-fucosyltransferase [Lachnospiraceae bacterium]
MLIVRAMGGLGNQLQQYALYRKLEHIGKDVRLDVSWFRNEAFQATMAAGRELELDYLNPLPYKVATEEEIRSVLGRLWEEPEGIGSKIRRKLRPTQSASFEENDLYHEQIFAMDHKYLVGYWACEKYYADIMELLREDITFPRSGDEALQKRNDEVVRQMEETVSVSVHIRRGDYLDDMNKALFGNICTEAYYEKALGYMRERFPEAVFFIFSDDIPYVKERYQGECYRIIDWNHGKDSFYDMMLMSRCKHNICANSTFSFWGARLNPHDDKVMIRPSIHKNTQVCVPEQMKELWKGWTLITPQGEGV